MSHSIRDYLEKLSNDELMHLLRSFFKKEYQDHAYIVLEILSLLEKREKEEQSYAFSHKAFLLLKETIENIAQPEEGLFPSSPKK